MRRALAGPLALLFAIACQSLPPPDRDRGQVVVELEAVSKAGLSRWRPGSSYDDSAPSLGPAYERVNYDALPDMLVLLTGARLDEAGPVPRKAQLKIERRAERPAFDHQQVLLGPHGMTKLCIENVTDRSLSLYTEADQGDGFELDLEAGSRGQVTLSVPGEYHLRCAEEESLASELVVAGTTYASAGRSGDTIFFDHIPPGDCVLTVLAPRLPPFSQSLAVRPGERLTVMAQLSVNTLPHVRAQGAGGSR
jgi:hypothetical protein